MGDIIIGNAPSKYRKALSVGDTHEGPKGNDGKEEAWKAAAEYCRQEDPSNCEKFLEYLERSGYASFRARESTAKDRTGIEIKRLQNKNGDVREEAAYALGNLAESDIPADLKSEMVDPLIKALGYKSSGALTGAADALGDFTDNISPYPRSRLFNLFADDSHVQEYVGEGIKKLKDMTNTLNHASLVREFGRDGAVYALGNLAKSDISPELKSRVVDSLIKALGDERSGVRERAAGILRDLAESDISPDLKSKIIKTLK